MDSLDIHKALLELQHAFSCGWSNAMSMRSQLESALTDTYEATAGVAACPYSIRWFVDAYNEGFMAGAYMIAVESTLKRYNVRLVNYPRQP